MPNYRRPMPEDSHTKKFVSFTTDDSTFFYAVDDIANVKFYTQDDELIMEFTTKSSGVEAFTFNTAKDYNYAMEIFNDL